MLKKLGAVILISYLLILITALTIQTKLIFYPGKLSRDYRFSGGEEVFLETKDGEVINGLFYPGSKQEVILYFHGNAGDLSGWQFIAEDFTSKGYNFFIIDYRGYGKSSGSITERGLYTDAEAAYNFLTEQKRLSGEEIIIYGRSVGSGVAVELATAHKPKGLILEAPYSSLLKLAREKAPFLLPSLWLKYHFNNIEKINRVTCPVLFIHGEQDTLIPPSHSLKLFETFNGKKERLLIRQGEHNDLNSYSAYHNGLREMLSTLFK